MSSLPLRFSLTYVLGSTLLSFGLAFAIVVPLVWLLENYFALPYAVRLGDALMPVAVIAMIIISYRRYYPNNWLSAIGCFWPQQSVRFWFMVGAGALLFAAVDQVLPLTESDIQFHLQLMAEIPLPLLLVQVVVMAPLMEELLFRQYLWQGLQQRWMTPVKASIFTSLLWALSHVDYSIWVVVVLFFHGCWLSWLRWRTGSLLLPIALHAAHNLFSVYYYWTTT